MLEVETNVVGRSKGSTLWWFGHVERMKDEKTIKRKYESSAGVQKL